MYEPLCFVQGPSALPLLTTCMHNKPYDTNHCHPFLGYILVRSWCLSPYLEPTITWLLIVERGLLQGLKARRTLAGDTKAGPPGRPGAPARPADPANPTRRRPDSQPARRTKGGRGERGGDDPRPATTSTTMPRVQIATCRGKHLHNFSYLF